MALFDKTRDRKEAADPNSSKRQKAVNSRRPDIRQGIGASAAGKAGFQDTGTGPVPGQPRIMGSYTVKKGDTLSQIAKNLYGSGSQKYWQLIQDANKDIITDPNLIKPGQVFKIPKKPEEL